MAHPRTLVVYYSRTGTTRKVAESIAAALPCDSEALAEGAGRSGMPGYLRSLLEAMRKVPSSTILPGKDPSAYDLVVIGTPVWAWSVSSPVRAYLAANRSRLPAIALFCTFGGAGGERAFAQMEQLAGKRAVALLPLAAHEVASGRHQPHVAAFVEAVRQALARQPSGVAAA
jgi:menaquinone-dependent protoporphyrinogen IX oxidase